MAVGAVLMGLVIGFVFVRRQMGLADPMIDVRLFRIPAFNAALATNFLGIFIVIGYFLFVAQYLQLVLGLSPLEAGLWSLPSAAGFIVGSQVSPRILARYRPAHVVGAGLAMAAVGLAALTQVGGPADLAMIVTASIVISLGLSPVFIATTELIVGSAPPERAGAASGISETGSELGGALGIAILGSIGTAVYRGALADTLPPGIPAEAAAIARDTLGGAVAVAQELPDRLGAALLEVAHGAFIDGMQVTSAIAAVMAVGVAVMAVFMLRSPGVPPAKTEFEAGLAPPEQIAHIAPTRLEGAVD
jgi:DHA2 family multidrug resistance protein-like MFS transporter